MEEGLRKSPRLVTASNPKVYRRNRKKLQVSSSNSMDEIPSFSLGISQISGEKNNEEENKKQKKGKKRVKEVKTMKRSKKICVTLASTSKKIVDSDDDFEDLPPQFQSKSLKNKDGLEKKRPVNDGKTRNRLPKSVILPESRYPLKHTPDDVFAIEINNKKLFFGLREFGIVTGLNCVGDGTSINVPNSRCSLMSSYFPEKITVPKSHLRALFLAKKFIDDDSAISLVVLYFINDFLFSYEDNEYQISNRDFYLVESEKFNSYPWGLDVYKKLSDSVRHELKSTHKYYRIGGLPLALQIWIFECCSKVDEDIAIRVADSIPRILNWKTIAESPWLNILRNVSSCLQKTRYLYKFENIVASEDEVSKFRLPETRDYHAEILKLEPKESNHGLDILTNEVIELRKELVNENNKALEEKIDLGFNQIKEFVVNSNKQLLEDISLLFAKSGGSNSVIREVKEPSKKHAGETFSGGLDFNGAFSPRVNASVNESRGNDAHVMGSNQNEESQVLKATFRFADVENLERVSNEDVAGIAIEKVLSEVVADINVQEAADVNTNATEDYQKPQHTLDDFILLDKELSQINRTEESYLKKRAQVDQNKRKVSPKKRGRKKNPGKLITSPFTQHFKSGGTLCVTRQVFETKHPFLYASGGDDESDLIDSFTKWLYMGTKKRGKKPYTDALNVINPAFELGVYTHIDVIFYYLRKKGKYETNNSDDIARYISGRRLLASTSWDKVDFVLIPLNIKENRHWIFVVFDIGQRSLEVYDSFPARGGVNLEVKNIVEMLSVVLPYYLSVVKFYDKRPELKSTPKYIGMLHMLVCLGATSCCPYLSSLLEVCMIEIKEVNAPHTSV
uniref:Ubiquitin-like protease family profile domain-containing protein n=1 Tax=Solanum lycopersicum TaxID=4081 RepID=A0A3Q7EY86_SOLLC